MRCWEWGRGVIHCGLNKMEPIPPATITPLAETPTNLYIDWIFDVIIGYGSWQSLKKTRKTWMKRSLNWTTIRF